jgi:plastocyanin
VRLVAALSAWPLALALVGCGTADSSSASSQSTTGTTSGPCSTFEDHSAASDDRTIHFGGSDGSDPFGYAPMCLEIGVAQSVEFSGDFSVHPLHAGSAPGTPKLGSPDNPIPTTESGDKPITISFSKAGRFPYYCRQHYAAGMVGEIKVR